MNETKEKVTRTGLEIAVIGMAGRFPAAKDIDTFWENLKSGVESVTFFSDEELIETGIDPEMMKNPNYVKAKGYLEDIQYFDAGFFNYTPNEAKIMDPQVRLFHQCVWQALENAGYDPDSYKGLIGLYAGYAPNIYWKTAHLLQSGSGPESLEIGNLNNNHFTSNICYKLNLKGPAVSINTTCSTSLVAIHMASRALLTGEADMALAGGVSVTLPSKAGYIYQEGMLMSPDGHCRPFDAQAEGMASGDGVGIVVLKRLVKALKDGDFIYAVIKGSAVNNDGRRKAGYNAPSIEGQADVIRTALRVAGVEFGTISYIETHGTGTPLGDSIEIEALKKVFIPVDTPSYKKHSCALGFVKANIGHSDAAAGAAGFIKTVLVLYHRLFPPEVNFETPNPAIDFENSPFYVNTELKEWQPTPAAPGHAAARAGVSAYGIGGTNAHVILEEWRPESGEENYELENTKYKQITNNKLKITNKDKNGVPHLIILSAKTQSALDTKTENLAEYLKTTPGIDLADVAYTLKVGRSAFSYRRMLVCRDKNEAIDGLLSSDPGYMHNHDTDLENRPVVFMFPGPGAQYINMGLELYHTEPLFRETMDRCFAILKPLGYDIKTILYPEEAAGSAEHQPPPHHNKKFLRDTAINHFEVARLVVFIFEYALALLLIKWGIKPHALIGHGSGEYVAACSAGVFSLEEVLTLLATRSKLMQEIPDKQEVSDAVSQEFETQVEELTLNKPKIPFISNITGKWITPEDAVNPRYWSTHMQGTHWFADGFEELTAIENALFLEVGPGETLSNLVRQSNLDEANHPVVNLVESPDREIPEMEYLMKKIGELWLYGTRIDWTGFYEGEKRKRLPLPSYPFHKQYYSVDLQLTKLLAEHRLGTVKFVKQAPLPSAAVSNRPESKTPYVPPRNRAEEILVQMWQDLLGIRPIGIFDNLMEMGVDSLKAIMFVTRFKEQLGEIIHVTGVFEAPTAAEFAVYFSKHYPESNALSGEAITAVLEVPRNFVLLHRPQGGIGNIFFVHEVCGDVGAYLEFCKQSGTRFNCWGIEAERLKNFTPQNVTIEEISARYIRQIKQIQPHGPYYLATWSFGGNWGLEMALQLEQMGETLAFLAFFDCSGPNGRTDSSSFQEYTLETEKNFLKSVFISTGNEAALEKIDDMEHLWTFAVDFLKTDPGLVEGLRQLLIENEQAIPNYHSLTAEELVQFLNIIRSFKSSGARYIPAGKIHTPIHYFLAKQNPGREEYWNDYCHTPVIYHDIQGDHHSIFRDKGQIVKFASKFKEVLEEISSKYKESPGITRVTANINEKKRSQNEKK